MVGLLGMDVTALRGNMDWRRAATAVMLRVPRFDFSNLDHSRAKHTPGAAPVPADADFADVRQHDLVARGGCALVVRQPHLSRVMAEIAMLLNR